MILRNPVFLLVFVASGTLAQTNPSKASGQDLASGPHAVTQTVDLERNGSTITIESYASNIVRVTISITAKEAEGGPSYGLLPKPTVQDGSTRPIQTAPTNTCANA